MEKMTEPARSEIAVAEFYDAIAPWYDSMTSFRGRFALERPFFHLLVERFRIRSAIDAGCGTGFHTLLLAQLGVDVTAVDISEQMLGALCQHARELKVSVKSVRSSFVELRSVVKGDYDAVFSMGNSLAHLLTEEELKRSLEQFCLVLKPSGVLFLQNLNYDRIVAGHERIQSIKEVENTLYVRFYDYDNDTVRFNILKICRNASGIGHNLHSIMLRPILHDRLVDLLREAGFGSITIHGGISLEEFRPNQSKDLVVVARKPD
jgi:2-polyprenyl-3-methyl-5-hydroxy-6-metoxy-1,4-benzoquinol methylase